ncbi:MAG TPA: class I SAM-dependent methyltransferase [Nitrososphaeraceae archaeon]
MKQYLRKFLQAERIVVELGMGDGRLLAELAKEYEGDRSVAYVGIEKDKNLVNRAKMRLNSQSAIGINSMFEKTLILFHDKSIDLIIMVLPDPNYIDPIHYDKWSEFYGQLVYSKLKNYGILKIVTEIIDDLLEPVSDELYSRQVNWLIETFSGLGFRLIDKKDGPPNGYSSIYLDKFGADSARIRIVTLDLGKHNLT